MNPFDYYGPQFLLFYLLLAATVMVAIKIVRARRELALGETQTLARLQDPYLIACLRGGEGEVIRVAMVSLIDRGLLAVALDGTAVTTTAAGKNVAVRKAVERELLSKCASTQVATDLFKDADLLRACSGYVSDLRHHRLLADDAVKAARRGVFFGALAVLLFFAIGKVGVGLSRGRPVGFLAGMTIVAVVIAAKLSFPRRTALGDRFLRDVRNLFESLKLRAPQIRSGGATAELALLAGVYGVGALPADEFGWSKKLFPKASASNSTASSCGSSCGSSSGSSCGGGGGCGGGGCGGCGG
jgi:uncharacterized protein (TIGR04222 family)